MFLLIDNYDSFTYNLVQYFNALGENPVVRFNDDPAILELAGSPELEKVCISPGPGRPERAGLCMEFLNRLPARVPLLGVCLGHQMLGLYAGARVCVAPVIMHGKQSEITHNEKGLFEGLPNPLKVGRYHSLIVADESAAAGRFTVTARGPLGEIMALRFNDRPWVGVQFHPESILTPDGLRLLGNFPGAISETAEPDTGINGVLAVLANGKDLDAEQAGKAFSALMDGNLTPAQAGAFLLALRMKGESAQEIAFARAEALARSVRVEGLPQGCIDIVGTGGDGRNSFNCSTAASLTLAGMGHKVIKHGNRAISSKCGAADALEAIGIPLEKDPRNILEMLEEKNFAFMFAPFFHPAFKNIAPIRKELGVRTLFNILGPLINPARPDYLMMGVARDDMVELLAETLLLSPLKRGAVFCGAGGYDELTPLGPAKILILREGKLSPLEFNPADFGIRPCSPEDLAVHSKEAAVAVLRELLAGRGPAAMLDMLTLNVALALYLLDENPYLASAVAEARKAVESGAGAKVVAHA